MEVTQVVIREAVVKILVSILFFSVTAVGQSSVSLKYVGLTIHPFGDETAFLQPYKLDKNAVFVANFGGVVMYEKFIWRDKLSVQALQAVFADCSFSLAGISSISLKGVFFDKNKHQFQLGLGPVFMIRNDWNRFENYTSSGTLDTHYSKLFGRVQQKFFPLGVEIVYNYAINEKVDFSTSMTPGIPAIFNFVVGFRYWISKDFNKPNVYPKL